MFSRIFSTMKDMDCLLLHVILILILIIQRQIVCFILTLRGKKSLTAEDGEKLNVIIPDFALDNNGDKSKFNNFELESLALDPSTKNLIASAKAKNTSNDMEDGIYRFSSLEFL